MPAPLSNSSHDCKGFEKFFREASAMAFNIQCLEGILKPLSEGDGEYLKPMIGETVTLSNSDGLPTRIALSWQIIYGTSILKPFAAELYLKALISAKKETPPKIHDLVVLFDKLSASDQATLDGLFVEHFELHANPRVPHIRLPNLRSVLEAHKNDFVGVRYGETVPEYLKRTADGMTNIDSLVKSEG